jgi:ATP/ADP translocase
LDEGWFYKVLRRVVDIRPEETRPAFYLFLHFFLVTFAFYIVKTVNNNFLISRHPRLWSYADLLTAALIGFVVAINAWLLNRLRRKIYVSRTLIFFVSNLVIFWFVFWLNTRRKFCISSLLVLAKLNVVQTGAVLMFSFWVDIFIAMSITQFWIAVNDIFHPYQVKRLVGFLVTGGLLGGVGGSLLTLGLARAIGTVNLILICPAALLALVLVVKLVYKYEKSEGTTDGSTEDGPRVRAGGYFESLRSVMGDRYLRILAGVLASSMVVGQLIKYQFNFVVKRSYATDLEKTTFLASFFLVILVLSTIFHLVTTGQVLKRFGIRLALLLAPSVLLAGTVAAFFIPTALAALPGFLAWAYCIRGAERTFDTTISQSVRELLYIPIRPEIKYKAKIFIDMFVNKFAAGLGAGLSLLFYYVLSFAYYEQEPGVPVRRLGFLVAGFIVIWAVLIFIIYTEYLGTVVKDLKRKWLDAHRVVADNVDVDGARLTLDTIQSSKLSVPLYLMNLFDLVQQDKLTPELKEILTAEEVERKSHSMDSVLGSGGDVFYPGVTEAVSDKEFGTQVSEILALDTYKELMGKGLAEVAGNNAAEADRMEAAKLIGLMGASPEIFGPLGRLLQDPSPEVLNYALASAAIHRRKEHVPLIIPLLGRVNARQMAQDTLSAYGPGIEEVLKSHLRDRGEGLEVRKAIPEVLARIRSKKASEILTEELGRGEEAVEQELIEALYRIRKDQTEIRFNKRKILAAVLALSRKCAASVLSHEEVERASDPDAPQSGRWTLLDFKLKRVFELLALIYPCEDIDKAYQNICQGTRRSVDYSLELLDNLLNPDLKAVLFPLIEDLPAAERVRRLKKALRGARGGSSLRRLKYRRRVV